MSTPVAAPIFDRDLDLLYELGCLRFVQRSWRHFLNADFANVTEHTFRVLWLALMLAKHESCTDTEKIMKMALVHDVTEIRASDVDYLSRQYVERDEERAVADMFEKTSLADEFVRVWHEYEKRDSLAAKIVKDADNLDVDLELREQAVRGVELGERWQSIRGRVAKEKLFTASAKKLFDQIATSDPHRWHLTGPNRFTAGDWKK